MVSKKHVIRLMSLAMAWMIMAGCPCTVSARAASGGVSQGVSAWLPYWDVDSATAEVMQLGGRLSRISLFAAYYQPDESLFVPQEISRANQDIQLGLDNRPPLFLTVVNDLLRKDQPASLKDRALLWSRLGDEAARLSHAEEILALAKDLGTEGIELDFENLGKDAALWENYAAFISLMQTKSQAAGLQLQVVLEPSALGQAAFPEGPQYVVMFYNLFGRHSGPGPKASLAFVSKLAQQAVQSLPGKPLAAFANGGYAWSGDGAVQEVTELAALALLKQHGVSSQRDQDSQAMTFSYEDQGQTRVVWYADGQTISAWAKEASRMGITGTYLWKLGSNEPASLKTITGLHGQAWPKACQHLAQRNLVH